MQPTTFTATRRSFFDAQSEFARRARLVRIARRALTRYEAAAALYNERKSALRPSIECVIEAREHAFHLHRRYNVLESLLADESGLAKWQVFNRLSEGFPLVGDLLTANL